MFSSIGYVKTYRNLQKTIRNFSRHLNKGGILVIEPWISRSKFKVGHIHLDSYNGKNIKIARMGYSRIKGNISKLEMHYLIGDKGGIKHLADEHELGLFDHKKVISIINKSGLSLKLLKTAKFLKNGMEKERGLYVCIKN